MNLKWWKARLKEASTKWGAIIFIVTGAALFTTDQIGDYSARLSAVAAIVGAYRLVVVQEAQKVPAEAPTEAPGGAA
jgi:hypothetical protein